MQSALRLRVNGVRALAPARRQFTLSSARLADSIPPKSGSTMTDGNNTMDKGANNNVTVSTFTEMSSYNQLSSS